MIKKKDIEELVNKKLPSWILLFRGEESLPSYKGLKIVSEDIKAHSLSIPLSLLESLEKDVEGMLNSEYEDGKYNLAVKDFLSLIKQYKEQLK